MMRSKSILGVNMLKIGDNRPLVLNRCMQNVAKLVMDGKVNPHVGGRFSVDQISEGHTLLESRKSIGKIIVSW